MKFIFLVRMKPGYTVDEYAEAWVRASKIIQQTPGAKGTYLHRKIGSPDTLLAIAHWESKAHRDAIRLHGETPYHRMSFRLLNDELQLNLEF